MPAASSAQIVRGTITDRRTEAPQPGVVVVLLDSTGNTVARVLTDERGMYQLPAGRAGTYRVRTLRIGFRPSTSDPIVLAVGQQVSEPALVAGVPISLETVRVLGRSVCQVRPDSAAATFAVWGQIRTALAAAQITAATRNLTATIVQHQRSLEPDGRRVLWQQSSLGSAITARPWRSLSADSLRRAGYAVMEKDGSTTYFAPDLEVLVSEGFAEDHCLRLVSEADRVGISFEPIRTRRSIPEISGTLWLDRATSELRRLEFRYVNMTPEQEAVAGGELDFIRLAEGGWLISRWNIRVPVIETRYARTSDALERGRRLGRSVREIRVEGGDLALVTRDRDTVWARPPLTLAGMVQDSSGAGISAARVELRGSGLAARTDAGGRFHIPGVLPGEYMIDIETPSLEAIGVTHSVALAFTGAATDFVARLPTADQVAVSLCGTSNAGMVAGSVRMRGDSVPPRNVKVVIEWNELGAGASEFLIKSRRLDAFTDAHGRFRACGVPDNTALTILAEGDSAAARPVAARIPLDRNLVSVVLTLDPQRTRTAALSGVILSDSDGQPIAEAEVALPALARSVYTNEHGAFRLSDIPPGTHQALVRRLGYRQLSLAIDFEANRTVERRLLLSRVVTLDTVSVIASVALQEFERNRRMGLGHFLTRNDLAKQEERRLTDVLAQVSGVRLMRGRSGTYVASRRGMGTSLATEQRYCFMLKFEGPAPTPRCACYAQVYLDNGLLYGGGEGETVPDLNFIPVSSIEAIEYYAGPSQAPVRYNRLNSQCGVVVIHTRRSP